jgi:hypothetical protein
LGVPDENNNQLKLVAQFEHKTGQEFFSKINSKVKNPPDLTKFDSP